MKNVVWPESPYGVCTTRSLPEPGASASRAAPRSRSPRAEHVRHARHAGFVAELRRHDLRVEPVPERRRRERDIETELLRELLGLLVEHQERGLAAGPRPRRSRRPPCGRAGSCRSPRSTRTPAASAPSGRTRSGCVPVERVVVVHEPEVANPAVDPEQVERGRRDEVDRRLVRAEEAADRRRRREAARASVYHRRASTSARGADARAASVARWVRDEQRATMTADEAPTSPADHPAEPAPVPDEQAHDLRGLHHRRKVHPFVDAVRLLGVRAEAHGRDALPRAEDPSVGGARRRDERGRLAGLARERVRRAWSRAVRRRRCRSRRTRTRRRGPPADARRSRDRPPRLQRRSPRSDPAGREPTSPGRARSGSR